MLDSSLKVNVELSFEQNGYVKKLLKSIPNPTQVRIDTIKNGDNHQSITKQSQTNTIEVSKPLKANINTKSSNHDDPTTTTSVTLKDVYLDSLLLITEGRDVGIQDSSFSSFSSATHLYCVSRVFWSKEKGQTKICWNSNNPFFQYQQVYIMLYYNHKFK